LQIWEFTEKNPGEITAPDDFFTAADKGRAVALGYFDGVHAGHREILEKLCSLAKQKNIPAMVHTFLSLPKSKLGGSPEKQNFLLTTVYEKCSIFSGLGLDETALFPFSKAVADTAAVDFLNRYLKELLHAKVIVAGEDYRFGRNREGDMHFLSEWGKNNGIEVYSVPPLRYNEEIISSTVIRRYIRSGEIEKANNLLGYPISYHGTVREGEHLGRTLGFPTANIAIEKGKVIPAFGVYASLLSMGGRCYPSITNVGIRPTVNTTDPMPLMETTMYDHEMDLYGQPVCVSLLSFVRPEQRFNNVDGLKVQVHKDMAEVRQYHSRHPLDYSNLLSCVI